MKLRCHHPPPIPFPGPAVSAARQLLSHAGDNVEPQKLVDACQVYGYLLLDLNADYTDIVQDVLRQMDRFFSLANDNELKQSVHVDRNPEKYGWTPSLGEPAYQPGTVALVESFDCGLSGTGRNLWPQFGGFQATVEQYWATVFNIGLDVLKMLALGLGLPPESLANHCGSQALNTLRLLHYPDNAMPSDETHVGIASHTDFECLTLILQSEPGLEIRDRVHGWIEVPHQDNQIVVLLDDMLERLTNGVLKATPHRVSNKHFGRRSAVLFMATDPELPISPLQSFVGPDRPSRFPETTQRQHLNAAIDQANANVSNYQQQLKHQAR